MLENTLLTLSRIRIRSKNDVILIVVALVVYFAVNYIAKKLVPDITDKSLRIISIVAMIIVGLSMAFILV